MASSPRDPRRYDTDLSDEQWAVVEALLPPPSKDGPKEKHPRREIVNAIFYVVRTGCAWRHLPSDFPPWQTVYGWFARWSDDGTVARVHDRLRNAVRDQAGRDPMASAGIVDAQSVQGVATVAATSRGYDAGKKTNCPDGRKRHIVVDILGLLMVVLIVVLVTAANVQDRDGGRRVLDRAKTAMPSIATVWADGGYAGKLVAFAQALLRITVEIVRKKDGQRTFEVLPRRWVVERTLSWISACRRLDHDYERLPEHSETMVHWAMIGSWFGALHRFPDDAHGSPPPPPNQDLRHDLRGLGPADQAL
jgi:transposase